MPSTYTTGRGWWRQPAEEPLAAVAQGPPWQPVIPLAAYRLARCGPVTTRTTAKAKRAASATLACMRNWSQVNRIMT